MTSEVSRHPLPPFTEETAKEKVRVAEDGCENSSPAKLRCANPLNSNWHTWPGLPQDQPDLNL